MLLWLGEPPVRFLLLFFISFLFFIFFVVLHLLMFFILLLFFICQFSSFTFSFRHQPLPFRGLSPGFYTHFILSAQPIAEWFATLSFSTISLSSYRERYGFEWAFFTHRRFLPYAPSRHFWHIPDILAQPAFIKVSLGAGSYFFESCRASYWSSKHRPGPSVCLIHSNPQSSYSERFSFKFYHILSWIACGESLIYLLLTRF